MKYAIETSEDGTRSILIALSRQPEANERERQRKMTFMNPKTKINN